MSNVKHMPKQWRTEPMHRGWHQLRETMLSRYPLTHARVRLLGPCLKMGWLGCRHHCRPPVALGVLRILHPCGQLQWEWEGPAPLLGGGERMQRLLAPRPWKGGGRCDIHDLEPVGLHPHWQTVKQRRKSCFSCLHINTKNGISGAGVYKKLHLKWPETPFTCVWEAKMHRKKVFFKIYSCACIQVLETQHVTCSEQNTVFVACAEGEVELNTDVPEGDIQQHQSEVNGYFLIYFL